MNKLPTDKSLIYPHVNFFKNNGLNNIWSYLPDVKALLDIFNIHFYKKLFIYGLI